MWEIAKTLDGTRLIEDMSVVAWEHLNAYGHVDTDINSWHFYIDEYERAKRDLSGGNDHDLVAKSVHPPRKSEGDAEVTDGRDEIVCARSPRARPA